MEDQNSTRTRLRVLPTQELLAMARVSRRDDDDNEAYWNAVWSLQERGTREVLNAALACIEQAGPKERVLGVDILAQGGAATKTFHDEAVDALLRLLAAEADPVVLRSIGTALGHRNDPRPIPALARLKSHPDRGVRFSVVMGLLALDDELAIAALVQLSADDDADVRNWATFGIGSQVTTDTPMIRDALAQRLSDEDADTRLEAMRGLAERKDERVLQPLVAELAHGEVADLAVEAAEALADPRLCPSLARLKQAGYTGLANLNRALEACGCVEHA